MVMIWMYFTAGLTVTPSGSSRATWEAVQFKDFTDGEDVIDLTAFTGINSMDDLEIT